MSECKFTEALFWRSGKPHCTRKVLGVYSNGPREIVAACYHDGIQWRLNQNSKPVPVEHWAEWPQGKKPWDA